MVPGHRARHLGQRCRLLFRGFEFDEPRVGELVERPVVGHLLNHRVHRRDQVAAGREDEAERIALQGLVDEFGVVFVDTDVALAGGIVDDDRVDVSGDQRLDGDTELFEGVDPRASPTRVTPSS